MRKSCSFLIVVVLLGVTFMMEMQAFAQDIITESQFKGLHVLLSGIDSGKTALLAVQGNRTIEVTEFTLMKQISISGIKTTFYLRNEKTGVRKEIAVYEASETQKSMSRNFWKLVCSGAKLCDSCAQLFGENLCK